MIQAYLRAGEEVKAINLARSCIRTNELVMPTVGLLPDNTEQTYERLLWKRFALDHERARAKLWGGLKLRRQ